MLARRTLLAATAAGLTLPALPALAATKTLKISHQFPGGTIDQGDFRDRLARKLRGRGDEADEWRAGLRDLSRARA